MPEPGSIDQLFSLAIQAERLAEGLYLHFANRFNRNPDINQFWSMYAAEESRHAHWLEFLRAGLTPAQLAQPADPVAFEMATRNVAISLDTLLDGVKTLQDAYMLANELEHDEVNTVFEFLICHFSDSPQVMEYVRAELNRHIAHLIIDFPKTYGTGTLRRGITTG